MVIQMTTRGVLGIVFRHRWRFLAVLGIVIGAGIAYCVVAKPSYKSEAMLLVKFNGRVGGGNEPMAAAAIQAQANERKEVMNSQARILHSRDILDDLFKKVAATTLYPELAASPPRVGTVEDKAAIKLDKDFEVEPSKDTNVIGLSLLNGDPNVAATALKALIDEFRTRQASFFQNPQSSFLQDQVDQARKQLGASQAAVEDFKSKSRISSLEEERTLLLRLRSEVRNNFAQQAARREEAESRAVSLRDALKKLPASIQLSDENDRYKAIDDTRARLTELRARETEMSANYRDDSVALRSLRAQIRFAEQELAERSRDSLARVRTGPNPVYQQIQADLMRAEAEAAAASAAMTPLEKQIGEVEGRLGELDAKQGQLQDLMLQQQVDEENFRTILQRSEEARVSEDLQRQNISSIVVVQQPTVPIERSKPRILLILAMSGLVGLAGALGFVFASEMLDEAFSQPDQIAGALKLPVLATFNVTPTAAQRSPA